VELKALPDEKFNFAPLFHIGFRRRFKGTPHLPHLPSALRAHRMMLAKLRQPHVLLEAFPAFAAGKPHGVKPIMSMRMSLKHKNSTARHNSQQYSLCGLRTTVVNRRGW
jgi:hypothetical protein